MAENDENPPVKPLITEATWGFLVLRLWIGFRMLFAGAEKFYAQVDVDGVPTYKFAWRNTEQTAQAIYGTIAEHAFLPLNPAIFSNTFFGTQYGEEHFLYQLDLGMWFAMALPWLLLVFGAFLILGILPRLSLTVAAFVFMLLSIGLMALPDNDGIAYLGIHIGLVAAALLMVRHARFCTRF